MYAENFHFANVLQRKKLFTEFEYFLCLKCAIQDQYLIIKVCITLPVPIWFTNSIGTKSNANC